MCDLSLSFWDKNIVMLDLGFSCMGFEEFCLFWAWFYSHGRLWGFQCDQWLLIYTCVHLPNVTPRLVLLLLWHTVLVLGDKILWSFPSWLHLWRPVSSSSDDLSASCTLMSFLSSNLLELSFAPTLAGCTGVHVLSVFSYIWLCHFRSNRDSSVNNYFDFLL